MTVLVSSAVKEEQERVHPLFLLRSYYRCPISEAQEAFDCLNSVASCGFGCLVLCQLGWLIRDYADMQLLLCSLRTIQKPLG